LGGGVGDALGGSVEFLSRDEIRRRFGAEGICSYAPAYGRAGAITDDTQMTLFTAEGLLRGRVRFLDEGIEDYTTATARAYQRWLLTQGNARVSGEFEGLDTGWLYGHKALHSRRAPGNTCLSSLRGMSTSAGPAINDSKGCGGVMRVAPVGLFAWSLRKEWTAGDAFQLGADLAALTHGHPTGSLTGGVQAVLVLQLLDGASLKEALSVAKDSLCERADHRETLVAIEQAEALVDAGLSHDEAIDRLGQGWIAEEALAISIYCALVAETFREGVILAVNHDGDSDSTGAITGNLLGAVHGVGAIPAEWLEELELRDVIAEVADDLYGLPDCDIGGDTADRGAREKILAKYPGW
jgi:ADP-ribosylglycohydrolase